VIRKELPMSENTEEARVLVIPCSGIGKVHGLIARECTYKITDELAADTADTLCLALLVSGDEDALAKVKARPCITIDGCPKLCAQKNVALAGGTVARSVLVVEGFKNRRNAQPGTAATLADEGWEIVGELAGDIACAIPGLCEHERE